MSIIQLNDDQLDDWNEIISKIEMSTDAIRELHKCDPPHLKASGVRETFIKVTEDHRLSTALARQLISLASYRRQLNKEAEAAVEDIIGSLDKGTIENVQDGLLELLVSAINSESIVLSSKALFLSFANESIYRDGNVITDIRPVFSSEDPDKMFGAVVMQTLIIKYMSERTRKSVSLSMDLDDIQSLIDALTRAKAKGEVSLRMLDESGYQGFITGNETYGF